MAQHEVGNEFLEYTLEKWAKNLYLLNNQTRITDDASRAEVEAELHKKWYPQNERGLTQAQRFTEESFCLAMHGLGETLGRVSTKAADAVASTPLVNAWRTAVWRNHFQQRYSLFEDILKETLRTSDEAAALAQFPKSNGDVSGAAVAKALGIYAYATSFADKDFVKNLIIKTDGGKSAAPQSGLTP